MNGALVTHSAQALIPVRCLRDDDSTRRSSSTSRPARDPFDADARR